MKKSTVLLLVIIAFVLGFLFNKLLSKNQNVENQGAAAVLSTTLTDTTNKAPREHGWAVIEGNNCVVYHIVDLPDGSGVNYTITSAPLSGPNLCSALSTLGVGRSVVKDLGLTISDNATLINQVGTSCVYYAPSDDGWTKDETKPFPVAQKQCVSLEGAILANSEGVVHLGSVDVDSFIKSIPDKITALQIIQKDPASFKAEAMKLAPTIVPPTNSDSQKAVFEKNWWYCSVGSQWIIVWVYQGGSWHIYAQEAVNGVSALCAPPGLSYGVHPTGHTIAPE